MRLNSPAAAWVQRGVAPAKHTWHRLLRMGRIAAIDALGRERHAHVLADAVAALLERADEQVARRADVARAREHDRLAVAHVVDHGRARPPQDAQVGGAAGRPPAWARR